MTEEQEDQLDAGQEIAQAGESPEEAAPDEGQESVSAEQQVQGGRSGWIVPVAVLAAILALCTIVACVAAAFAAFRTDGDLGAMPTAVPGRAVIAITEPDQGQVVEIDKSVSVEGTGAGLTEGNVVVEALDWQGNVLDRQPTTLQGRDVGTGGEGTWSTELAVEVEAGTAGRIRAYHPSPLDGTIVAEDVVEVSWGQAAAAAAYIQIEAPDQGATLDVSEPIQVSGAGAGLPEGNVVVVAVDGDGNVLAEQPTTLQGADVGTGGAGTWSVALAVPASGRTPGYIAAFAPSPKERNLVVSDLVEVTFSGAYMLEGTTWLLDNTIPGSEITAVFANGQVSGSAGCNTYRGTYRSTRAAGRNTIEIGPLATTRMMCDESHMEQERLYLAALEAATEYAIEGFALSIEYPGGELLFYDKNGPRPRR